MTERFPREIMNEMLDQAVETFDMAVKSGMRMQEEASRWWSGVMCASNPFQVWPREAEEVGEAAPVIQRTVQEGLRTIDRNWRSGMDLLRKMIEAGESAAVLQRQAQEIWEASVQTWRTEVQAVAEANARAMEMWTELAKENAENVTSAAQRQAGILARAGNGKARRPEGRARRSRRSRGQKKTAAAEA